MSGGVYFAGSLGASFPPRDIGLGYAVPVVGATVDVAVPVRGVVPVIGEAFGDYLRLVAIPVRGVVPVTGAGFVGSYLALVAVPVFGVVPGC